MEFPMQESIAWLPPLLHGIFPTQGLNPSFLCLLHWQVDSLPLVTWGAPYMRLLLDKPQLQPGLPEPLLPSSPEPRG